MNKLQKEILDWHTLTFKNITLESQILKWQEEFNELQKTKTKKQFLEEISDCAIVATGLLRFGEVGKTINFVFMEYLNYVFQGNDWLLIQEDFEIAVEKKFEINKKRKWNKVNGCYRHCE